MNADHLSQTGRAAFGCKLDDSLFEEMRRSAGPPRWRVITAPGRQPFAGRLG